jgi:hypothetical protein
VLWVFVGWQRRRERAGADPLVHLDLLRIPTLRAGLQSFLAQNLILMGVFFTVPLYLQLVLGLDALETGIRMLPVSIAMFVAAIAGARLRTRFAVRTIVRTGFGSAIVAILVLLSTVEPTLRRGASPWRWRCSGSGWADRLPARRRGPVLGGRLRAQRGRGAAVHRDAARVRGRGRADRRDRALGSGGEPAHPGRG